MSMSAKQIRHPYITIDKKVRNGEPVISGTGIRILDVAIRYEIMGMSAEDIIVSFPHLNLSQVHDALSYYYEHKNEVDRKWKVAIKNIDTLKKTNPSILEKKIGKIKDIH